MQKIESISQINLIQPDDILFYGLPEKPLEEYKVAKINSRLVIAHRINHSLSRIFTPEILLEGNWWVKRKNDQEM